MLFGETRKPVATEALGGNPRCRGPLQPLIEKIPRFLYWQWSSLRVITSSLLRPEGGVSMRTDGQDGHLEHWRDLYSAALVELSSDKLPQRIRDAQRAIVDEIECRGGFQTEHQALLDALLVLLDLEKNHRPDGHTTQINKSA